MAEIWEALGRPYPPFAIFLTTKTFGLIELIALPGDARSGISIFMNTDLIQ